MNIKLKKPMNCVILILGLLCFFLSSCKKPPMDVILNEEQILYIENELLSKSNPEMAKYQKDIGTQFISIAIIGTQLSEDYNLEIYAWESSANLSVENGCLVIESGGSRSVVIHVKCDNEQIDIIDVVYPLSEGYSVIFPDDLVRFENGNDYWEDLAIKNTKKAEEYFGITHFGSIYDIKTGNSS